MAPADILTAILEKYEDSCVLLSKPLPESILEAVRDEYHKRLTEDDHS